jgi:hypothetical protein
MSRPAAADNSNTPAAHQASIDQNASTNALADGSSFGSEQRRRA